MGEITDDILNGRACEPCGEFFFTDEIPTDLESVGYVRNCGCDEDGIRSGVYCAGCGKALVAPSEAPGHPVNCGCGQGQELLESISDR